MKRNNTPSASTNGLYWAIFLIDRGILSSGRMTLDKKRKIDPNEIEAKVAVSSDSKTYPIAIPNNVNKVVINKRIGTKI